MDLIHNVDPLFDIGGRINRLIPQRPHLIHAAMLGDEALRAKLIDRYAAFERLIAEKIAERTDVVSADYLTQLILLASDGMIVQEALRNDNFDAAAFVRQSEAYLRVLRPADRI